jgi:predicted RND superfamily exporter protein
MSISGFRALSRFGVRHPLWTLVIAALITLAAAPGVLHLKLRTDGHALVPANAPEVIADGRIRAHFGIHDQIVVLIRSRGSNGVFNPGTLRLVRELSAEFCNLPGIPAAGVLSLATEPSFRMRPATLTNQRLLEPALTSQPDLDQLREDIRRIGLYTGTLISEDGKSTVILVSVPEGVDHAQFQEKILQAVAAHKTSTDEIGLTGAPVAEALFGIQILGPWRVGRVARPGAGTRRGSGWSDNARQQPA